MTDISFIFNLFFFISLGINCSFIQNYQLQFVQILWRHGDRAPIALYPVDPNPAMYWPEGLSSLTQLGKKQHYIFGQFLRQKYSNFITSDPLEVNVVSSDVSRCIRSAESNLAAFFKPTKKWQFLNTVDWQPISISYIPQENDLYLETGSYCPAASEEQQRVIRTPKAQEFLSQHQEMFQNLSYYSGLNITNWTSASYLHDTLFIEKKYGLITPQWALAYWNELSNVSDASFYWSFNSPLLHRLRAGPLIGLMVKKMKLKIAEQLGKQKIQIYSAHDTNVAVLLNALNLFNMKQPPYCSAIVMELYKDQKYDHVIRLVFYNSTTPEQGDQPENVLILDGCSEYCSFDFFLNYTKDLIPEDWNKECRLEKTYFKISSLGVITASIVTSIVLVIIILVYFICAKFCCRRKADMEYSYQLMTSS